MELEQLKRIFQFLEEKEGHNAPFMWKLINNESLTEEELNVKGDLNLRNANITSLPEGLKVGGNFYLTNSNITSLPEGLKVDGGLDLRATDIILLPKGLKVGRDLDLRLTEITSLPKGLKVGGRLYIGNAPLREYSDNELREMVKPDGYVGKIY